MQMYNILLDVGISSGFVLWRPCQRPLLDVSIRKAVENLRKKSKIQNSTACKSSHPRVSIRRASQRKKESDTWGSDERENQDDVVHALQSTVQVRRERTLLYSAPGTTGAKASLAQSRARKPKNRVDVKLCLISLFHDHDWSEKQTHTDIMRASNELLQL